MVARCLTELPLACVTAAVEKATLEGTINGKHNRHRERERRWGPTTALLSHFKGLFQRFEDLGGEEDRSGSTPYLLRSICPWYEGGGAGCLMLCDLMHGGKKECCAFGPVCITMARSQKWLISRTHMLPLALGDRLVLTHMLEKHILENGKRERRGERIFLSYSETIWSTATKL